MDGSGFLQTTVVSVNIDCCKACPKKLKKSLLKIKGVRFVTVDVEKKLVSVMGNADPQRVVDAISKLGKKAQLLSSDEKEPNPNPNPSSCETMDNNNKNEKKKQQESGRNQAKSDDDHKAESYYPPLVHDQLCKDPFCIAHNRWAYNRFLPSDGNYPDERGGMGCSVM